MLITTLSLSFLSALPVSRAEGDDWPHLRGPALDGRAASGVFDRPAFGLRTVWKAPLGPSYSGVAVADGRVVTLFSDGSADWVVALDADDGSALWRRELGPTYLGHDGSEDGPISSPVIADGTAYVLGPHGKLLALGLEDGGERWSLDLVADLGAKQPDYGFTSTPLVEGELLIVQAGGSEGRLLCGLERASGGLRWSVGEGEAGYASPLAMDLAGERQVLVLNGREILGVAPASGALLWSHLLGENDMAGSGIPGAIDGHTFFASVSGAQAIFRVTRGEVGYAAEELVRATDLGRTYAAPVAHDGYLYGFKSDFLTCVDLTTGKRAWRSRPPGGKGLILVGAHLVVFGAEGVLAVARATPDGYEEQARLTALDHSSFTWPSFAHGRLYLRNNAELACVEVVDGAATPALAADAGGAFDPGTGDFGRFLSSLAEVEDRAAAIDAFLAAQESFPLLEGERVHFVYRGPAEDVAVAGSMVDAGSEPLRRVEGTDLYHRSYTIEPGARWEYLFQVDYDQWGPDPLNPRSVPSEASEGVVSELATPGYQELAHFREPTGLARGRLEAYEFTSAELENTRAVSVYLPAGYDESEQRYPLLIVHRGPDYLEKGQLANTLDNLIGTSVAPLVAVFVEAAPQWWHEAGGTGTDEYLDMLAGEFVRDLELRYRLLDGPEHRALLGLTDFGLACAYGGLRHPEVFGLVAVQSPALADISRHALFELIESEPLEPVAFHVAWNRYEIRHADRGSDHAADSRRLFEALRARGYVVTGGEALDAAGWGAWRAQTAEILETFFPLE